MPDQSEKASADPKVVDDTIVGDSSFPKGDQTINE